MDYDPNDQGQTALFFLERANHFKRAHPELFSNTTEAEQAYNTNAIWNAAIAAGLSLNDENVERLIEAGTVSGYLKRSTIPIPVPGSAPLISATPVRDENGAMVHQPISEEQWMRTAPLAEVQRAVRENYTSHRDESKAVFQPTSAASMSIGEAIDLRREQAQASRPEPNEVEQEARRLRGLSQREEQKQRNMTLEELRYYLDPNATPYYGGRL